MRSLQIAVRHLCRGGTLLRASCLLLFLPLLAFAHQPRIVEGTRILVPDPEVSKAYYGQLRGQPHIYRIEAAEPFALYVNVLVPDIPGQRKDISATITRTGDQIETLTALAADASAWKRYWEEFGRDWYWMGPEYRRQVAAGVYEIQVRSPGNAGKYALAIGEREAFDYQEGMNALRLIPVLKREFFQSSPTGFLLSPFGYGYVLSLYAIAFVAGYLLRWLLRRLGYLDFGGRSLSGRQRVLIALLGIGLLSWAISTSWNAAWIFLSGLALFIAVSGWSASCARKGSDGVLKT